MNKCFILFFILASYISAQTKDAYINIISNVKDTTIFLDAKKIGKTPITQYKVTPNKTLYIDAIVDKEYYKEDIKTILKVNNQTIPTLRLQFQKAKAKIFFVGDDAQLYINDKFIKKLNDSNRVILVDADKNMKIRLVNGYDSISFTKDIKAKTFNTIKYTLLKIPKEVRLYTSNINNLMWEDTLEAANKNVNWKQAFLYCENLQYGKYDDFRLPTIDELDELYEYKDKIYNGFGGKFYWSSTTFQDKYKIWDYSRVKNFENGIVKKSIKEFEKGRVRCVRDINNKNER